MAVDSVGTVKEVLGTCVSLGCTVDGKSPKEITAAINAGEKDVPKF
jgi:large subunit ribosomal protein L12e